MAYTLEVRNHVLTPAEAEVRITVVTEEPGSAVELRGRLMGPRCVYSTTVEVAYPLRPLPGPEESGDITARVIIPEPSLWDPVSPFLYEGPIQVWRAGVKHFETTIGHGLRSFQMSARGLRWNGQLLSVRAVACTRLAREDAERLRTAGFNTLITPVSQAMADIWYSADRFGFLVLGKLSDAVEPLVQLNFLSKHPCCLGWLISRELLENRSWIAESLATWARQQGQRLGVELKRGVPEALLQEMDFIFCNKELIPIAAESQRYILVRAAAPESAEERTAHLGWILE